jgi:hypothetical protein
VARLPLSALLSQALVAFTVEADNEAEHRLPHRTTAGGASPGAPPGAPWNTSLLMWANCLRHLPDEGITVAELYDRARTGTNLDGMRRWGYVTFTPSHLPGEGPPAPPARGDDPPTSPRGPERPKPDTLIRPTAWGSAALETWHEVTAQVESRWRDRLGAEAFAALRVALADVVARLDPALPDCLPILRHGLFTRPDQAGQAFRASGRKRPAGGSPGGPAVPVEVLPPKCPAAGCRAAYDARQVWE